MAVEGQDSDFFSDGWKSHHPGQMLGSPDNGTAEKQKNKNKSEGRQACFPLHNTGHVQSSWQCLASFFGKKRNDGS